MSSSFAWLKIYRYLDENPDPESAVKIQRDTKMSYVTVLDGIKQLEDLGVINVQKIGRHVNITKTQKFFEVKDIFLEIDEAT